MKKQDEEIPLSNMDYIQAMRIIKKELKSDKSEGSMFYAWKSNLACIIYDNHPSNDLSMEVCNNIAIKFLERLID
jgi:hypothetical protein